MLREMANPRRRQNRKSGHGTENLINAKIDRYERLKEIEESFLPSIREDLRNGMKAEDILKKYKPHAAAALVTSLTDPKNAIAAADKILDRVDGKPVAKQETTHRFEKLTDTELEALLTSRFNELDSEDKKDVQ